MLTYRSEISCIVSYLATNYALAPIVWGEGHNAWMVVVCVSLSVRLTLSRERKGVTSSNLTGIKPMTRMTRVPMYTDRKVKGQGWVIRPQVKTSSISQPSQDSGAT